MKFRPHFSLRSLFVLIALISILLSWVGWQMHLVRERQALIQAIWDRGGLVWRDSHIKQPIRLPWYRKLLADDSVFQIMFHPDCSEAEKAKIKLAFPETKNFHDPD